MFNPPPYVDLNPTERQIKYDQFFREWQEFLRDVNVSAELYKDYYIHKKNLFEIIRRCDKRRVYMAMFHELEDVCEYKIVAIEAFWINTLKPFLVVNEDLPIYSCPNEMYALYRILAVIRAAYEKKFPGKPFDYPSPERIQDILYDFKYCSISRESMVAFVETFADVYGVGISDIFKNNKRRQSSPQE